MQEPAGDKYISRLIPFELLSRVVRASDVLVCVGVTAIPFPQVKARSIKLISEQQLHRRRRACSCIGIGTQRRAELTSTKNHCADYTRSLPTHILAFTPKI